jgi:uncharacterized membrane protein HdeD (DUF308 family)
MKFTRSTLAIAGLAATSVSAFAPTTPMTVSTSKHHQQQQPHVNTLPTFSTSNIQVSTARFLSDNTANDFMEKAQKQLPDLLLVDVREAQSQLAKNWGWITTSGVLTLALGTAALLFPILASGLAYDITWAAMGASGVVGLINAFARENGHRAKSSFSGLLYCGLAYVMATNPGAGLDVITLSMAFAIGAEGIFETALAAKNKDLQGRGWHFVSGIGSVLASAWLATNIPASSLFAPGAALGARLTSNGATKIAVGLEGKKIADAQKNA